MSAMRKEPGRRGGATAAAVAAIVCALTVPAGAQGAHMSLRQTSDIGTASRPSSPDRAAKSQRKAIGVQEAYYGRAPYICTPSGFGRTASCFLRVRLGG